MAARDILGFRIQAVLSGTATDETAPVIMAEKKL